MRGSLVDDLKDAFPGLLASVDAADRVAYARDLWPRHHLAVRAGNVAEHRPGVIVWPDTTLQVAALVRWAGPRGIPLVPFGAGSGVCAGVLPREDVVVVDLKRMARWRTLDRAAPSLDVEAGQMGMPLEQELQRLGYTLGHFPSSILCSTVGGWVAARSAGQCSGYYGKIEDMVIALECVTGKGEIVTLRRRAHGPDLVPLVVGSEGTLAIVTAATLRLHPAPTARAFSAWSFASTEKGWDAMRSLFQAGLRPAVSRLYDPFDAMLARMGGVKRKKTAPSPDARADGRSDGGQPEDGVEGPGRGAAVLRTVLRRPGILNGLLEVVGSRALGGALLVLIFEGSGAGPAEEARQARAIVEKLGAKDEGEAPARRWLDHRYAVSYRQAPVFAAGAFSDTMEVAASWTNLGALYDGVRRALGQHVFVMAHMSHAYPDGCCIYFSFAGSAVRGQEGKLGWDEACQRTYDRAWQAALAAAIEAGGTIAHHHGVGRSKAPRLGTELGVGVDVVWAMKRAFDPYGIFNPGNLLPPPSPQPFVRDARRGAGREQA
jgi:alkyldihydroxyacetonephosphate synthase